MDKKFSSKAKNHPYLYITNKVRKRLKKKSESYFIKSCNQSILILSEYFANLPPLIYLRDVHNEHLRRAREVQNRIISLLCGWEITGKEKFRKAVIEYIRMMKNWDVWSWIAWREGNFSPDAIFDLSYGENSATLAIAYDWLFETLSQREKSLFLETAKKWSFSSAKKNLESGKAWWFKHPMSNWNTVCAGGLGMLAMAMINDFPEAEKFLLLADESIKEFFNHLKKTDGAWPEGIGYWNYGMGYGFKFLLSYENFTGEKHPVFSIPEFKKTLRFPLEFSPNGIGCSFGDSNHFSPQPIHLAVAERVKDKEVSNIIRYIVEKNIPDISEPEKIISDRKFNPEWCLFYNGKPKKPLKKSPVIKLYKGQDWAVLSDDFFSPTRAMTIRGGTTKVPHGNLDLLSFHCTVGKESMITNLTPAEYLDTTFSPRRWDIFETRPDSKNTIFINGVGIVPDSSCNKTELFKKGNVAAVRIIATDAFGQMRDGKMADFVGRLIIFVREKYWIIIDRVQTPHPARIESRMQTFADIEVNKDFYILRRGKEKLSITFASTVPSVFLKGDCPITTPSPEIPKMLRWITDKLHKEVIFAFVINPGGGKRKLVLSREKKKIRISVAGRDGENVFLLTPPRLSLRVWREAKPPCLEALIDKGFEGSNSPSPPFYFLFVSLLMRKYSKIKIC